MSESDPLQELINERLQNKSRYNLRKRPQRSFLLKDSRENKRSRKKDDLIVEMGKRRKNKDDSSDDEPEGEDLSLTVESDEYFDYDTSEFKQNMMEALLGGNLEEQPDSVREKMEKAVDRALENIDKTHLHPLLNCKPADRQWKKGLSSDDVEKLEPELDQIRKDMEDEMPNVSKILQLSIPRHEKARLLEMYDILENTEPYTNDYMDQKNKLVLDIIKFRNFPLSLEKIEELENVENRMLEHLSDEIPLRYRILDAKIDDHNKMIIYEKYRRMLTFEGNSNESAKIKSWIEWALSVPFEEVKENTISVADGPEAINTYMLHIQQTLNQRVYGLEPVKEQLIHLLNNRITSPESSGNSLAMVGSPGTGKTMIARAISDVLQLPFQQISMGGTRDASFLEGHDKVYESASPGIIVKVLKMLKYKNGIVFFDELDKLGDTKEGLEVAYSLLHITDFTQNNDFRDKYLSELSIDLSNLWFVFAMNDDKLLDKILLDRLPIVRIKGYTQKERVDIAKKFIMPELLKNVGMSKEDVIVEKGAIETVVSKLESKETGVRALKKLLSNIVARINMLRCVTLPDGTTGNLKLNYAIPGFSIPFTLTKEKMDILFVDYNKDDYLEDMIKQLYL